MNHKKTFIETCTNHQSYEALEKKSAPYPYHHSAALDSSLVLMPVLVHLLVIVTVWLPQQSAPSSKRKATVAHAS
jgi:hypothetical protein